MRKKCEELRGLLSERDPFVSEAVLFRRVSPLETRNTGKEKRAQESRRRADWGKAMQYALRICNFVIGIYT